MIVCTFIKKGVLQLAISWPTKTGQKSPVTTQPNLTTVPRRRISTATLTTLIVLKLSYIHMLTNVKVIWVMGWMIDTELTRKTEIPYEPATWTARGIRAMKTMMDAIGTRVTIASMSHL